MAGGKATTFENDLLKLIFNAIPIAGLADNAATSTLTNLFVSLHLADPGPGGTQTTSEATYSPYTRVPVARNSGGWTVVASGVTPVAPIIFPTAGAGANETLTHVAVGTAASGASKILYHGPVTAPIVVEPGVTPQLLTSTTITES